MNLSAIPKGALDIHYFLPIPEPPRVHYGQLMSKSTGSMDIHSPLPTAKPPNAHSRRHGHMCIRSMDTHSLLPTVSVKSIPWRFSALSLLLVSSNPLFLLKYCFHFRTSFGTNDRIAGRFPQQIENVLVREIGKPFR